MNTFCICDHTKNMKHLFYQFIIHLPIYHFLSDFIRCGITGWCLEIVFTAFHSFRKREMSLKGTTSIWMFPIYGMAALLAPLSAALNKKPVLFRGCVYTFFIFLKTPSAISIAARMIINIIQMLISFLTIANIIARINSITPTKTDFFHSSTLSPY